MASLQVSALQNARDIELDPDGDLYVLSSGSQAIFVLGDAAGMQGDIAPTRTIRSPAFEDRVLVDALLDGSDRLFVVTATGNDVLVFDDASNLDGEVAPSRVISLSGAQSFGGIAVGPDGTAYVSDTIANAIYVLESAGSRTGTLVPERTIQGPATGLSAPSHLLIHRS